MESGLKFSVFSEPSLTCNACLDILNYHHKKKPIIGLGRIHQSLGGAAKLVRFVSGSTFFPTKKNEQTFLSGTCIHPTDVKFQFQHGVTT